MATSYVTFSGEAEQGRGSTGLCVLGHPAPDTEGGSLQISGWDSEVWTCLARTLLAPWLPAPWD